ncbi:DUF5324 family protein [Kitasatospora sp. NPDC004240]
MTRLDSARETATNFADGAKQRLSPALDALGPMAAQAAHTARVQYDKRIAPQFGHAFASLPPDAQQNVLKAVHRAQEAALAAKLSAARAAEQARTTVVPRVSQAVGDARTAVSPVAQEAQVRGAAALTALQGHVTAAEISEIAARNIKREQRGHRAKGLAVAGTLTICAGVVLWQWTRNRGNPEWLVEPTTEEDDQDASGQPHGGSHAAGGGGSVNGSPGAPQTPSGDSSGTSPAAGSQGPGDGASPASGTDHDPGSEAGTSAPKPGPTPGKPGSGDDRPKPHDPRKPH